VLCLAYVTFSTLVLHQYGSSLFVILPLVMTALMVLILSFRRKEYPTPGELAGVWVSMLALSFLSLLICGVEGLLSMMMAAGLVFIVGIPFFLLAFLIRAASRHYRLPKDSDTGALLLMLMMLPLVTAMEYRSDVPPQIHAVTSTIDINAPRAVVWNHVIHSGEITDEPAWYFQRGVAYPIRARIEGTGVGAIRYCEFSTGPFVEPITIWDEPRHLAFTVTSSPPAMTEWNPFHEIAPPHIDDYFESHRGEFYLEDLGNPRTRLTGTTWYSHRIAPSWYWRWWTEFLVHDIHDRVLGHVAALAEAEGALPIPLAR